MSMVDVKLGGRGSFHVPVALAFALLVQAGSIVWWTSAHDRNDAFNEQRVVVLETRVGRTDEIENQILQRLARIEERGDAQVRALDWIEKQMAGRK